MLRILTAAILLPVLWVSVKLAPPAVFYGVAFLFVGLATLEALRVMRVLWAFRPRLIGSTMTGHVRQGSGIDLHVFADRLAGVTDALDAEGFTYDVERKRVRKFGDLQYWSAQACADKFKHTMDRLPARCNRVRHRARVA